MDTCPLCQKKVHSFAQSSFKEAWVHNQPYIGMLIYGPYSAEKTTLCISEKFLHFKFDNDNTHRLVELGAENIPDAENCVQHFYVESEYIHCQYCGQSPDQCDCKNDPSLQLSEAGII